MNNFFSIFRDYTFFVLCGLCVCTSGQMFAMDDTSKNFTPPSNIRYCNRYTFKTVGQLEETHAAQAIFCAISEANPKKVKHIVNRTVEKNTISKNRATQVLLESAKWGPNKSQNTEKYNNWKYSIKAVLERLPFTEDERTELVKEISRIIQEEESKYNY